MKLNDLIKGLERLKVQTGSLACLGCGYEHGCGAHGCAILREAERALRAMYKDLQTLGDCAACQHDKAVGYDDAPCTCCMRGEKWEWRGYHDAK